MGGIHQSAEAGHGGCWVSFKRALQNRAKSLHPIILVDRMLYPAAHRVTLVGIDLRDGVNRLAVRLQELRSRDPSR